MSGGVASLAYPLQCVDLRHCTASPLNGYHVVQVYLLIYCYYYSFSVLNGYVLQLFYFFYLLLLLLLISLFFFFFSAKWKCIAILFIHILLLLFFFSPN